MPTHLTVLVAIEIISIREKMLSRFRDHSIEAIIVRPGDDISLAIKRNAPDALMVHLSKSSRTNLAWVKGSPSSASLELLPILALLDNPIEGTDFDQMSDAGITEYVSDSTTDAELIWRLKALSRLGRPRRVFAQREPFEEFLIHAPDGLIVSDASDNILFTNPAARALFDSNVTFEGSVYDLFSAESHASLQQGSESSSSRTVLAHRVKLGNPYSPFYEAEVTTTILTGDRRLFSLRLCNPNDELDANTITSQRLDVLGQLTGGIAHDLNNVINAVVGGTTLLEMDAPKSLQPQIQNILNTAKRGGELLQQLLLFSRGSDVAHEPTNLCEIIRECAAIAADTFPRNIEVRFRGPPHHDYPPIIANSAQIHQILMNLCVNARDGMPDGGELIIAIVQRDLTPEDVAEIDGAKVPGNYLMTEVRDSGTGISAEIRSRIFEPFFTTKPKGKGTGLGLPTVMRLMQLHGGFVSVQSASEIGTSVKCFFPSESIIRGAD